MYDLVLIPRSLFGSLSSDFQILPSLFIPVYKRPLNFEWKQQKYLAGTLATKLSALEIRRNTDDINDDTCSLLYFIQYLCYGQFLKFF